MEGYGQITFKNVKCGSHKRNFALLSLGDIAKVWDIFDGHDYRVGITADITSEKPEYTFLSTVHGIFFRTDHILGQKTSLHKFKSTELISSIISDHNCMKLEINNRKRRDKKTNYMESKQHATKKTVDQQCEIKKKIFKISWDKWQWKHRHTKSIGCSKSSS